MHAPKNPHLKAAIEIVFIIFLFYANFLMGKFTASAARNKTILTGLHDIFTVKTLAIAVVCAILGHLGFDLLRRNS